MLALRIIIGVLVLAFFAWLMMPSNKKPSESASDKRKNRSRRVGFLIGYLSQRRKH